MSQYLLTYDTISSGTKTSVFTTDGTLVASAYRALPITFKGDYAQQSPQDWWQAVIDTTHELLDRFDPSEVAAICFTTQSQVCLCVDRDGNPLMDAITWSDTRSLEVEDKLAAIPQQEYYKIAGLPNRPVSSVRKLMWVKEKWPEIYAKTYKMIQCKDYMALRFTGRAVTDYTDASSTYALDIQAHDWSRRIIETAGLDMDKFPEILESNEIVGCVTEQAARETGLCPGIPVVIGAGDILCSSVGAGLVKPGKLYMSLGSSTWMSMCSDKPIEDMECMRVTNNPHAVPGLYSCFCQLQEAGVVFKWLKNSIFRYDPDGLREVLPFKNIYPYTCMEEAVKQSPVGANGLLCIPHLLGAASNAPEPYSAGAYIGLLWTHTREDMMRAAMEGATFEMRRFVDLFRAQAEVTELTVVGIASHEKYWLQVMADVFNLPVRNTELTDTPDSIGCAIVAGQAVGVYDSFDVADRFRSIEDTFLPDPERAAKYERIYQTYLKACAGIKPALQELAQYR